MHQAYEARCTEKSKAHSRKLLGEQIRCISSTSRKKYKKGKKVHLGVESANLQKTQMVFIRKASIQTKRKKPSKASIMPSNVAAFGNLIVEEL